jgi:outer membrane protein insertion porin family
MGKKGIRLTVFIFIWCSSYSYLFAGDDTCITQKDAIYEPAKVTDSDALPMSENTLQFNGEDEDQHAADASENVMELEEEEEEEEEYTGPRIINYIHIIGNKHVPTEAILDRMPFLPGEVFQPEKTRALIRNLYYELKRFSDISIEAEYIGHNAIDLYIIVKEKKPLLSVTFKGNTQISEKDILEKINFNDIPAIAPEELNKFAHSINKLYIDKGYLRTRITSEIIEESGKLHVVFSIVEGQKSVIKRVNFCGNNEISGKTLRALMITREDWLFGFMDRSGTYNPDWIERDKHIIEQYYQNNGFINAKVYAVDTENDICDNINLTVHVDEGEKYSFGTICVNGSTLISEEFLLRNMPAQEGAVYSRENIIDSIKFIEFIFSDLGFLYTQVEPSIQPNDITKKVDIQFNIDTGMKVFLNKLTIRGNKKTRDKIIRRSIPLEEGGIITNRLMDIGKNNVEGLGYFDTRDGVNWKTTRVSEDEANLDLVVKEVRTGSANVKLGFGGPEILKNDHNGNWVNQLMTGVSFEGSVSDTNVAGTGVKFNVTGKLSTKEQDILVNLTQPWLFDKPIYGSVDAFHRRAAYDQLTLALTMNEQRTSASGTLGVVTGWRSVPFFNDTYLRYNLGVDRLTYDRNPQSSILPPENFVQANIEYQEVLDKLFYPGKCIAHFAWMNVQLGQDKKNHPMHPSNGYSWMMRGMAAIPSFDSCIGYAKWDLDANWFTPLIGPNALVLRLHGYLGIINQFGKGIIPYRELFHIGGPASVRGFLFGQIGPQFSVSGTNVSRSDSIGGSKTAFINVELIFPIMPDFSFKGLIFYDGGTGWDNPYADLISRQYLINNNFDYRHAVGFGLRVLQPMPMKIDWGFKLDPRPGEPGYEVHFAMGYDW